MIVADIIPNPPRTQLICEAEKRGCKVLDGLGMLVNQGVIGVKYWTGVDVDRSGDASNHSRPVRTVVARPHLGAALVTTTPMALRVRHRRPKASFRPIEMVPICAWGILPAGPVGCLELLIRRGAAEAVIPNSAPPSVGRSSPLVGGPLRRCGHAFHRHALNSD